MNASNLSYSTKRNKRPRYLRPLKPDGRRPEYAIATFDLETKAGEDPCKKGFDRIFLVGVRAPNVYDRSEYGLAKKFTGKDQSGAPRLMQEGQYHAFFDEHDRSGPWNGTNPNGAPGENVDSWPIRPNGSLDRALEFIFSSDDFCSTSRQAKGSKRQQEDGERRLPVILFAHNGGRFDFTPIVEWLLIPTHRERFDHSVLIITGRIVELTVIEKTHIQPDEHLTKCKNHNTCGGCLKRTHPDNGHPRTKPRKWLFRDSIALVKKSLDDWAETLNLEGKIKIGKDHLDTSERERQRWTNYNKQDCRVLAMCVETYQRQIRRLGGEMRLTTPSTAMDTFRRTSKDLKELKYLSRESHFHDCADVCPTCGQEVCNKNCRGQQAQIEKQARQQLYSSRCEICEEPRCYQAPLDMRCVGAETQRRKISELVKDFTKADAIAKNLKTYKEKKEKTKSDTGNAVQKKISRIQLKAFWKNFFETEPAEPSSCPSKDMGCHHNWIYGPHDPKIRKQYKQGVYCGGRTEILRMRETRPILNYYDINSSYPRAMLEPMPVGQLHQIKGQDIEILEPRTTLLEEVEYRLDMYSKREGVPIVAFVECYVEVPENCSIPPLGVVREGKLMFHRGRFYGKFDWCELRHLKEIGGQIIRIRKLVWFRGKAIFKEFVLPLWEERLAAKAIIKKNQKELLEHIKNDNKQGAEVCEKLIANAKERAETLKLLLNSLYGKFGQNPYRRSVMTHNTGDPIPDGHTLTNPRWPNHREWPYHYVWNYAEADYFIPQIAAHITALARERLWLGIYGAEHSGTAGEELSPYAKHTYYVDTDSLITDAELPSHLSGKELGQWELERRGAMAIFLRPKEYILLWDADDPNAPPTDGPSSAPRGILPKEAAQFGFTPGQRVAFITHMKGFEHVGKSIKDFFDIATGKKILSKEMGEHLPLCDDPSSCSGCAPRLRPVTPTQRLLKGVPHASTEAKPRGHTENSDYDKRRIATTGPEAGIATKPRLLGPFTKFRYGEGSEPGELVTCETDMRVKKSERVPSLIEKWNKK